MAISKEQIASSDSTLYTNVACDQIKIAEDKLRLKLIKHLSKVKKSRDWVTYLGIFLSSGAPIVTADFKSFWVLNSVQVESFFKFITIGSACLLFRSVWNAIFNRTDLDKIVEEFKTEE